MQCRELLLISLKFFTISYHSFPSSTETSNTLLIDLTEVGVNLMDTLVCPNGCISPLDGVKVNSLTAYNVRNLKPKKLVFSANQGTITSEQEKRDHLKSLSLQWMVLHKVNSRTAYKDHIYC